MKRFKIVVALMVGLPLLVVGGLIAFLLLNEYAPPDREPVTIEARGDGQAPARGIVAGEPFTLLSWNIQFGAGTKVNFFYNGGEVVHTPRADVDEAIEGISGVIGALKPDVLLLQELDRASARTHYIDQLPIYTAAGGFDASASAIYHRAWVPKPFTQPLGSVEMHLAVLAKGGITDAERVQLALMDEMRFVQAANLKRALLTATLPIEGHDQPLAVAVTHLSAFSRGDGTLEKQVGKLVEWIEARPEGQPWVLAGDFNLLPPGDDKSRLGEGSAALYAEAVNPISALIPKYRTALADQLAPENRTYVPFGEQVANRKIDYVFYGGPLEVVEARVLPEHHALSDHLPMWVTFRVGPPAAPAPVAPEEPAAGEVPEGEVPPGELPDEAQP